MTVELDNLDHLAEHCATLSLLVSLPAAQDGYLVGGVVRDALLGRPLTDLDFAFPHDPTPLAREFARRIEGHWFWLDAERRQSRVVPGPGALGPVCDFSPYRAIDLEADLRARDFTMNAMALPLANLSVGALVDPTRGLADLRNGVLRMTSEEALSDDPLRILKGIRHAADLALEIAPETLHAMRRQVAALDRVAPERIRQECWKTLAAMRAAEGFAHLLATGAGVQLYGEGFARAFAEQLLSLKACRHAMSEMTENDVLVAEWLQEEIEQGLSREILLVWTFHLRTIDPLLPAAIAARWLLSRRTTANMAGLAVLCAEDVVAFQALPMTSRVVALWAQERGVEPKLLLPALVILAAGSPELSVDICPWIPLVETLDGSTPRNLVDGRWLRERLGLKDGPEMGRALQRLRKAELSGEVADAAQARHYLLRWYDNKD